MVQCNETNSNNNWRIEPFWNGMIYLATSKMLEFQMFDKEMHFLSITGRHVINKTTAKLVLIAVKMIGCLSSINYTLWILNNKFERIFSTLCTNSHPFINVEFSCSIFVLLFIIYMISERKKKLLFISQSFPVYQWNGHVAIFVDCQKCFMVMNFYFICACLLRFG